MVIAQSLGKIGEDAARAYLEKQNYRIKDCNYSCKSGEIDIIAIQGSYLVFVEVKTRSNLNYGTPAEAVNYRKIQRIRKSAERYIQSKRLYDYQPRFDVIEVMSNLGELSLNHIENAF